MNISDFAQNIIDIQINELSKFKDKLPSNFDEIIKSLSDSKYIYCTGVGKSGFIAQKFSATLISYGLKSIFLNPTDLLHGDLGLIEDQSSIIIISKSGSSDELIRLIPYLSKKKLIIIAITGNSNSFLAKNSNYSIDASVETESCPLNIAPTSSTSLALLICDVLSGSLVKIKNITKEDFAVNHPSGQIGRNNTLRVEDVMFKGIKMPLCNENSSIKDAIIEINNKNLGCVCIIENSKIIGIFTDGDLRRALNNNIDINKNTIGSIMTKNPITCNSNLLLGEALSIMENRKSQINVLPVTDSNDNLIGILRIHDIYGGVEN